MRSSLVLCFIVLVLSCGAAQAQTPEQVPQIQRISIAFTANSSSTDSNYYVLDFNNPIFEHDDVMSCRELRTASRLIREVCDSYGVSSAEFTRYSIIVHTAKLIGESALQNILSTIRQDKNIDLQRIDPSNVAIQLSPMPPMGCVSFEGFSSTNGQSCAPPALATAMFSPGCTSLEGFSATTGQSCSQRFFPRSR